ncbi:COesterase and/or Abhydrolase 3 domain containing protein, partial [Asbolus verrucosus]
FKAPQPAQDWDGILDTTYTTTVCRQATSNTIFETEDCLYINVFTPQLPGGDGNVSFPVIFYIHGGGFIFGTSIIFGPDNFINNDVILVSFNYRLGPYGFLSTQDEIIPGNNGLKDQLLALKWTHNNIKLFGGDPEKITLFGVSAGSASCAYHLLNHQSKGLFRGAILESGSSLSPWAYQRNARKIAFKTASFLNSTFETNNDSTALLEYLQSVDASDLDAAAEKYYDMENGPENIEISQGFYWAPVLEVKNSEAFITEKMYGLFQSGNVVVVPIIIGITSEESLLFNPDANVLKATLQAYDEHLDWLVPNDMRILNSTNRVEMGRLIREIYTQGEPLSDYLGNGIRYSSDTSFTRSVIKTAELLSKVSETYFYQFSYDGKMGHFDIHYDGAETVAHAEETSYLFCAGFGCDFSGYPELDQIVQKRLITIWTNFAKYL